MLKILEDFSACRDLYEKMVSPVCEKYELTYMELTVLLFLSCRPDHDTAADIVKCRHLSKSHVSISVRSLQEKGLLTGEYRGENRRSVHLKITRSATPILQEGQQIRARYMEALFDGFSQGDRAKMESFAKRISENVRCRLREAL